MVARAVSSRHTFKACLLQSKCPYGDPIHSPPTLEQGLPFLHNVCCMIFTPQHTHQAHQPFSMDQLLVLVQYLMHQV